MPFRSEAQRRFLFAKHPDVAEKWAHEYGTPSDLPEHVESPSPRKRALKRMASKAK